MIEKSEDYPEVTLLILNYNGIEYIEECLDSVLKTDYPRCKVIVIDNASNDGSSEFVEKNYPQVKLFKNPKNYGFAKAYNDALKYVESNLVLFLNNDVLVESEWLKNIAPYMMNDKSISAINPKILLMQNKNVINAAGGNCDLFGVGWNRGNGEIDRGQYEKVEEVFYANGAAMLTRRDLWKDVGPFDEQYFLYGEDLDWCWRARLKGYKILYVPTAKIYHKWRASKGQIICLLEKHWLATFLKNYSLKNIFAIMPRLFALKILKALWLFKNGKDSNEKLAVFDSFLWNLVMFKKTWKKRLLIQASRRISDEELQKHMYNGSFELLLGFGRMKHPLVEK